MDLKAARHRLELLADELRGVRRMAGVPTTLRYAFEVFRHLPQIFRTRNLRPADDAMAGRVWNLRVGLHSLALQGAYWSGAREMYGRAVYLPSPEFTIRAGDRVVDLGANVGLFTLLAAAHGAQVLAVEAQSGFTPEISRNLADNHLSERATIVTALVGAGIGVFADPTAVLSGSHGHTAPPVVALGALLDAHGFHRVDLLKMDIEGSEFALFGGDCGWVDRVQRIAMEVHPRFGDPRSLVRLLTTRGFRAWTTDDRGHPTDAPPDRGGYLFALRSAH